MKNKYYLLALPAIILCACNSPKESIQSADTPSSIETIHGKQEAIDCITRFKTQLLSLNHTVSSKTYSINQVDNYYSLDIETKESGTTTLYNNDFLATEFEQQIGETSKVAGRRESGITPTNNIYSIDYFGENDNQNKVTYYENNAANKAHVFNFGFVNDYVTLILDLTLYYYESEGLKLSLATNYDSLDLSKDGTHTLQYRFIYFAGNGTTKLEEVQRDDKITILNGKIVSSETTMLYGQQDSINYKYMESTSTYAYDALTDYSGTKLNPSDFTTVTPK